MPLCEYFQTCNDECPTNFPWLQNPTGGGKHIDLPGCTNNDYSSTSPSKLSNTTSEAMYKARFEHGEVEEWKAKVAEHQDQNSS